jgi:hypothetical protein
VVTDGGGRGEARATVSPGLTKTETLEVVFDPDKCEQVTADPDRVTVVPPSFQSWIVGGYAVRFTPSTRLGEKEESWWAGIPPVLPRPCG